MVVVKELVEVWQRAEEASVVKARSRRNIEGPILFD